MQLFQLQAGKDHGWADGGIVRKQHHSITLPMEVLEGGLAANAHCGDLALLHLRLAANAYDVAVADGGGHAVTVAGQGKVSAPRGGNADIAFNVLLCRDRSAAGNGTDQRDLRHGRQRLKARRRTGCVQPQQIGRGGLQRGCQLFHLGLRQVVDAFFQLGNGGFGPIAHALGKLFLRKAQFFATQMQTGRKLRHAKPL